MTDGRERGREVPAPLRRRGDDLPRPARVRVVTRVLELFGGDPRQDPRLVGGAVREVDALGERQPDRRRGPHQMRRDGRGESRAAQREGLLGPAQVDQHAHLVRGGEERPPPGVGVRTGIVGHDGGEERQGRCGIPAPAPCGRPGPRQVPPHETRLGFRGLPERRLGVLRRPVGAGHVPRRRLPAPPGRGGVDGGAGRELLAGADRRDETRRDRVVPEPHRRGGQLDEEAGEVVPVLPDHRLLEQGGRPRDDLLEPVDLGQRPDHRTLRGRPDTRRRHPRGAGRARPATGRGGRRSSAARRRPRGRCAPRAHLSPGATSAPFSASTAGSFPRGRAGRQSRVSLRCVTRCGRAASAPSRSTLFCS